jgi:hypothetical protein
MSAFSDLIRNLEDEAKAVLAAAEAEGKKLVQEIVPVIEDAFAAAVADFGTLACQLVVKFAQEEFSALTGGEKHGEVVTHLVMEAETQGKALAIADAQALAKNAFLAVTGQALGN